MLVADGLLPLLLGELFELLPVHFSRYLLAVVTDDRLGLTGVLGRVKNDFDFGLRVNPSLSLVPVFSLGLESFDL